MNNSVIAFCTIIGLTVGLFAGNVFVAYGRRKTIIFFYLILLAATGITLIENFWAIAIGKFIMSFAAGNILIATNLILNETIPRQLNSLFGNLVNFGIITGIFMELALGLAFPDLDSEAAKTTQIWRIAYGFQLIPGVISLLLWAFVHTYETPQFIVDKGRNEEAMRYLKKIYKLKHPHGYQALLQELEDVTRATKD